MGFSISWIAFQGISKDQALERLALRDTGEPDEANETKFSGASLPAGWYLLFSNTYGFVNPKRLTFLSAGCKLVACNVEEHVMVSGAHFYDDAKEIWMVEHNAQQSILHLSVSGTPPPSLADIRARLFKEQTDNGGEKADVDYVFDIPIEVAHAACGYRHDKWEEDFEATFTRLESTGRKPKKSWFW